MLFWIAVAAVVAGAGLAVRWILAPRDAIGRSRPFPVYAVSGLLVVGIASAVPVIRHHRLEQRLSSIASRLVGHPVTVHCQTAGEEFVDAGAELGYVRYDAAGVPEARTVIKREPCAELRSYLSNHGQFPSVEQLIAVHVLTHEAMHMRGLTNEAEAECAAVQRDARTAQLLGATSAAARSLALRYYRVYYPDVPDDYRTGECARGARLDEGLTEPPW